MTRDLLAECEFPFQDSVAHDYRADEHLLGDGAQRLFLARRAHHPDERYLMCLDRYDEADLAPVREALGYRLPGVLELAHIGRFDELGVNWQRDDERRHHWAMLERVPTDAIWLRRALSDRVSLATAVALGRAVGAVLATAVRAGVLLTGARPEYIWTRRGATLEIAGLTARGDTFFAFNRPRPHRARAFTPPLFERWYCAPEIYRDDRADDRSLVFTLAVMIAEWATGQYPFPTAWVLGDSSSMRTGAHAVLHVPPSLEVLLSRSLQPDPGQRMRLDELLDALRHVDLDEAPVRF